MHTIGTLWKDVRYAARSLRRTPGFAMAAVLTLALGIGANTAIFSVLNAAVLRPLPYADPDRIVGIWNSWDSEPRGALSPAEYFDYRDRIREFAHLGVWAGQFMTLTGGGEPTRLPVGLISQGVLPALGVAPSRGRSFTADEDLPGRNDVVLLSDGLWRQRFGSSPTIVGQRIVLDNRAHTVVGVMPPDFRLPSDFESADPLQLYVPLGFDRTTIPGRGFHFLSGVARLAPGVSREQAAATIGAMAAQFSVDMPLQYTKGMRFATTVTPLHEDVVGDVRPTLLILLGAIGFVLLIACANVTNLFLSRSEGRQQELAIRAALGAGRADLIRHTLLESGLLAFGGGALGVLVAVTGARALTALKPPDLPRMDTIGLDVASVAFAAVAALLVGLLVGLVPALRGARIGASGVLRDATRGSTSSPRGHRLRRVLVASEVALAIVLLLGAGLMARSFMHLLAVNPGYQTDHALTASISLPPAAYPDGVRTSSFFDTLLDRVRAQRGVSAAGAVAYLPLASNRGDLNFQIEGRETAPGTRSRRADWQVVTPGYFTALGMRVLKGRDIESFDRQDSPGVVIFNEAAARLHWPDGDALGARLTLGGKAGPGLVTVIGIVNDVRHSSLRDAPKPEMYLAHSQFRMFGTGEPVRSLTVVVRASADPAPLAVSLRREVAALDPNVPVGAVQTMQEVRRASVSTLQFVLVLLSAFAGVALAVALIGVYGVMAYSVAQRRREIGLRVALGANPGRVIALVLRQGLTPTAIGIAAGVAGGIGLSRFLTAQLFEVSPGDPLTAGLVTGLVAVVALFACYLPARRAAHVDPLMALRQD